LCGDHRRRLSGLQLERVGIPHEKAVTHSSVAAFFRLLVRTIFLEKLPMKSLFVCIYNQLKAFLNPNYVFLNVEISTNRLLLKPISMIYKADIFVEFTDEVTTYMYPRPAEDISETESFINDSILGMKNENHLILVIIQKDSQEFFGCAGIHRINSNHPELGIWLKKSAHGNGYGLETVTELKKWAEENLKYRYLVVTVHGGVKKMSHMKSHGISTKTSLELIFFG